MAECIECGSDIALDAPEVGEIVDCGECGVELEVTGTAPVAFSPAPEEQEDWGE